MWWFPFFAAAIVGALIYALQLWQQRRDVDGAREYRARYVQLVAQLESLSLSANQLVTFVPEISDSKVLDYYESTLRVMETLLSAICKLSPFGSQPADLGSAFFLAKDCKARVERTQKAFRDVLRGKSVRIEELHGRTGIHATPKGCYFCSRPFMASRFAKVRVRLDDEVREVVSCSICKDELEHTKKVKVLYFLKDGQPVHWSEVTDYVPSEDYWDINRKAIVRKTKHLELVRTTPGQPNQDA